MLQTLGGILAPTVGKKCHSLGTFGGYRKATKNSIEIHGHSFRISGDSPIKERALRSLCTVEFDMMMMMYFEFAYGYLTTSISVASPKKDSGCPSSLADPGEENYGSDL